MVIRLKKAIQEYSVCSSTSARIEGYSKMLQSRCHPHFGLFGVSFNLLFLPLGLWLQTSGSFGKIETLLFLLLFFR
jgi:hypothetical protein